jgi:hypothetical protein
VKKTKAAEKRKASALPTTKTVKKLKTAPMSSTEPIDAIPISLAPPTRKVEEF